MELAYGRALFDRYGRYESDPALIVAMLEDTVADMQSRAGHPQSLQSVGPGCLVRYLVR
jgi:hypothetical protein